MILDRKFEDRGAVKRIVNFDFEDYLTKIKGAPYAEYRRKG